MHFDTRYIEEAITLICINRYITIRNILCNIRKEGRAVSHSMFVSGCIQSVVVHNRVHS